MTFFLSHVLELLEEVVVWDERWKDKACLKRIKVTKENVDSALLDTYAVHNGALWEALVFYYHGQDRKKRIECSMFESSNPCSVCGKGLRVDYHLGKLSFLNSSLSLCDLFKNYVFMIFISAFINKKAL